jgi:hypothetical protein
MDFGNIAQEIISTVGGFINTILGGVIRLFNSLFGFLPAHLRTGVGVVVIIIIGVVIYFLWGRD